MRPKWCGLLDKGMPRLRKDGKPRKTNRFAGPCAFCGRPLMPGEGCIEPGKYGGWDIMCLEGIPTPGAKKKKDEIYWGPWDDPDTDS